MVSHCKHVYVMVIIYLYIYIYKKGYWVYYSDYKHIQPRNWTMFKRWHRIFRLREKYKITIMVEDSYMLLYLVIHWFHIWLTFWVGSWWTASDHHLYKWMTIMYIGDILLKLTTIHEQNKQHAYIHTWKHIMGPCTKAPTHLASFPSLVQLFKRLQCDRTCIERTWKQG